ncbi:MAG: head maturation protease, ClpP-related [Alphaproteobacteria bacterium]
MHRKSSPLAWPIVAGDIVQIGPPQRKEKLPGYKFSARKGADTADIYIYGIIGDVWFGEGVMAKDIAADLKGFASAKTINVRINSDGGSVFEAKAIYSLLRDHGARIVVHVDSIAASAASFIAMAGDEINIAEGAFFMIHNVRGGAWGLADEIRRYADTMDVINDSMIDAYAARTGNSRDKLKAWLDAETYFTAKEAKEHGFADEIVENLKVAACLSVLSAQSPKLPQALMPRAAAARAQLAAMKALLTPAN